ncbi:RNA polymerase sigma factor [Odoribacter laneus]|jgi:RNA polymerase sigma factor, sigma-70 family|uniref:Sigma-70 family RNA polymerase sigma factor n=1 Tax=Odoribacter laneus YIT 12061 TaxID=742817 RepID=H1DIF2_9BACT|nr:RNA polymerase sigma factor [Odoribacter laneus]MBS1444870.1 RNA polymerase sigma factor [Odoribacter sp.]EHP46564.1 sigma-70 family RNA polymerase sigma factor [Odoribacter laneus YIT 12061]CCZ80282.1 sigma-70 family RNA polymerase sigma factor [Odoribacter laneus CAG:561]GKI21393.1 RNA polymerase sigma factor [Odoribacter laneus]GKI25975.1 RNA polymerase sigma factor [Odoribacter laneus]
MGEQELVKRILEGDEKAFRLFVDIHKVMVVNTCYAFLHNREEAEDIAQDVFIQAFESLKSFRFDCKLSSWLYRMAVNRAINSCKSFHKRRIKLKLDEAEQHFDFPSEELPVQEKMEAQERRELLHRAIDSLPENQRKAIILNKYEDLSYKEVADIMNISLGAVESLIFRAKTNLEKKLKPIIGRNKMISQK